MQKENKVKKERKGKIYKNLRKNRSKTIKQQIQRSGSGGRAVAITPGCPAQTIQTSYPAMRNRQKPDGKRSQRREQLFTKGHLLPGHQENANKIAGRRKAVLTQVGRAHVEPWACSGRPEVSKTALETRRLGQRLQLPGTAALGTTQHSRTRELPDLCTRRRGPVHI